MDYLFPVAVLSSFAMGFWACNYFQRAKIVRIARKAADTRKINKLAKEQAK